MSVTAEDEVSGPAPVPIDELARGLVSGERRALSRAITLVESERESDRAASDSLFDALAGHGRESVRALVSGPPGVGKSTLIEALGRQITGAGRRLAVLAVDPSSRFTGGSLLGDKTRMPALANDPNAFVRPSPAKGRLGGVARRTREAMLLCEAAGFDVVIVETVGVGQGEHAGADLADAFLLVLAPGAGDELQGMKRGIVEVADLVAVNKADGADRARAEQAAGDLERALALFSRHSTQPAPAVLTVSALDGRGVAELWTALVQVIERSRESGAFAERRAQGLRRWLRAEIESTLLERWLSAPGMRERLGELEARVVAGALTPRRAALELGLSGDER